MPSKSEKRSLVVDAKKKRHGIPDVLSQIRHEKISEVIPVKVPYSLKIYLQKHHNRVSRWIRDAIIEKLKREASSKC